MRKNLVAWLLAAQACVFTVTAVLVAAPAEAVQFSKEVGKPVKDAQAAIAKKPPRWDEAMAKLEEADGQSKKTALEQFTINELMAYVLYNTRDQAGAGKLWEQDLNSSQMPAGQVPARVKQLAHLYSDAHNYPKAIEYGDRWLKTSPQ